MSVKIGRLKNYVNTFTIIFLGIETLYYYLVSLFQDWFGSERITQNYFHIRDEIMPILGVSSHFSPKSGNFGTVIDKDLIRSNADATFNQICIDNSNCTFPGEHVSLNCGKIATYLGLGRGQLWARALLYHCSISVWYETDLTWTSDRRVAWWPERSIRKKNCVSPMQPELESGKAM